MKTVENKFIYDGDLIVLLKDVQHWQGDDTFWRGAIGMVLVREHEDESVYPVLPGQMIRVQFYPFKPVELPIECVMQLGLWGETEVYEQIMEIFETPSPILSASTSARSTRMPGCSPQLHFSKILTTT